MARKPRTDAAYSIRLTPAEYDKLSSRAAEQGVSRSQYLINILANGLPGMLTEAAAEPRDFVFLATRIPNESAAMLATLKARGYATRTAAVRELLEKDFKR